MAQRIENIWAVDWLTVVASYGSFIGDRDVALIERAKGAVHGLTGTACISSAWCFLAEMLYLSGRADEAAATADRALAELEYGSYFSAEVQAYRIKSITASRRPDPDWAVVWRDMDRALHISQAQQRLPNLAICHFHCAQLHQRQGARDEASRSLDEAERLFAEMSMTGWLGEARRLRKEI